MAIQFGMGRSAWGYGNRGSFRVFCWAVAIFAIGAGIYIFGRNAAVGALCVAVGVAIVALCIWYEVARVKRRNRRREENVARDKQNAANNQPTQPTA
jgi:FtsH-binding integral membrane protein